MNNKIRDNCIKCTIITATHNSAKTIENCIQSVAEQDYCNVEHLIIDGVSSDGTLDIIERLSKKYPNIRYITEPDKGLYDALNKGVQKSKGRVVGFVHSDDFLASNTTVSKIMEQFSAGNVDGVYGDLHYVNKFEVKKIVRTWKSRAFASNLLKEGWMPPHPTLFLNKAVYNKHGGFKTEYKIAADYDFMLRILSDETLVFRYIPYVITKMRVGGASNRSLRSMLRKTREDYIIMKKNKFKNPLWALGRKNCSKLTQFVIK